MGSRSPTWRPSLAADHGIYGTRIVQNGAAAVAWIQAGDIIVQIDPTLVTDSRSLGKAVANHNPGDVVAVHIYRGSQHMTINVTLGELQAGNYIRSAYKGAFAGARVTSRIDSR